MSTNLTPAQQAYLAGLRAGDLQASGITIQPAITDSARQTLINFEAFLRNHGHPSPQPAGLGLAVSRTGLLALLHYANDRDCLILQSCFGFDEPPVIEEVEHPTPPYPSGYPPVRVLRQVGQTVLLNKGNFQQSRASVDSDFFEQDTVLQNAAGDEEFFLNVDPAQSIPVAVARGYLQNFRDMYAHSDPVLGYLLPVKALIHLLTDAAQPLGSAEMLTFRWGLTTENLGNYTLIIGIDDLSAGPTIEFRFSPIHENLVTPLTACPPNRGCK